MTIKLAYHGNNGNYMRVLVDGKTIKQFKVEQGIHEYIVLENQDQETLYTRGRGEDIHEITLYKQTDIHPGLREHTAMAQELVDWLDEMGWFRG